MNRSNSRFPLWQVLARTLCLLPFLAISTLTLAADPPKTADRAAATPKMAKAKPAGLGDLGKALGAGMKAPPMPSTNFFAPGRLWRKLGIVARPKAGGWAEYEMRKQQVPVGRMKVSVLKGPRKGTMILEMQTVTVGGPSTVKLLLRGGLDQPDNVERVMLAQPGMPPIELPMIGLSRRERLKEASKITAAVSKVKIERLAPVTLEVPAGRFETKHSRLKFPDAANQGAAAREYWTNPKEVKALALVAWQEGDVRYVLMAQGDDAKSALIAFPRIAPSKLNPNRVTRKAGAASAKPKVKVNQGKGKARAK